MRLRCIAVAGCTATQGGLKGSLLTTPFQDTTIHYETF